MKNKKKLIVRKKSPPYLKAWRTSHIIVSQTLLFGDLRGALL